MADAVSDDGVHGVEQRTPPEGLPTRFPPPHEETNVEDPFMDGNPPFGSRGIVGYDGIQIPRLNPKALQTADTNPHHQHDCNTIGCTPEDVIYHEKKDAHGRASRLSEVILGGQDGLVNTLGVIMGLVSVTSEKRVILAGGLAATFAESFSMGAVAYTSMLANQSFYESEKRREYRHIRQVPNVERHEVQSIFARKGFTGDLLSRIVDTICSDEDVWVDVMLSEEHNVSPVTKQEALKSSFVVFLAALLGSFIPILGFIFTKPSVGMWVSIVLSAVALFVVGFYKSRAMRVGNPFWAGVEMTMIGMCSALVGWLVGLPFN